MDRIVAALIVWLAWAFSGAALAYAEQTVYVEDQVVLPANASKEAISAARMQLIDRLRAKALKAGEKLLAVRGERVVRDGELKETTAMSVGSRLTLDKLTFEQRTFGSGRKILRGKASFIVNYSIDDALANLERVAKREGIIGNSKVQTEHLRHEIERFRRQLSAMRGWGKRPTPEEIAALQEKLDALMLEVRSAQRGKPVLFAGKLEDLEAVKPPPPSDVNRADLSPKVFKEKWVALWRSLNERYRLTGTDIKRRPINYTVEQLPSEQFYVAHLKVDYKEFRRDWIRFMETAFGQSVVTTGYGHCLVFDPAKASVLEKANMRWIIQEGIPFIRINYRTTHEKWGRHIRDKHADFPAIFFRVVGPAEYRQSFLRLATQNMSRQEKYLFDDSVYVSRPPIKKRRSFVSDWHVGNEPMVFRGQSWKLVKNAVLLAFDSASQNGFKIATCLPGKGARISYNSVPDTDSTDMQALGLDGDNWNVKFIIANFATSYDPPKDIEFAHDVIFYKSFGMRPLTPQ